MNLMSLRRRSFGAVLTLGLGLSACGPNSERIQLSADAPVAQTFQEWCTDWQLSCPAAEPDKTDPLSADQFKALTTILGSVLASPSSLSLTRQDLNAAGLKTAVTALHLDEVFADTVSRLDARQWQSGALENGAVLLRNAIVSSQRSASGVILDLATSEQVNVAPAQIKISGVSLSSDTVVDSQQLESLSLGSDTGLNLGLSDRLVNQVPQTFALDTLLLALGIDTGKVSDASIELPDILAAAGPLIGWLNQGSRQVALDRSFFSSSAPQLGVLIPDDGLGKNLGNLLNTFEKIRTSSDPKSNLAAVTLVKGATAKCDVNSGEIKVKFAADFGLKRYYQVNPTTLGVELYGVEASAKKALGISIKLKRLELGPEKISILDIPILGKVDLKWADVVEPGQKTILICGA